MAQSSSASGTSSRRHLRDHDASSPGSRRYPDTEWESKEAIMLRELEEAKARTVQMEKTMRWWSDCTANWREKWSEVRDERNKAKKETKVLKTKLEVALKDLSSFNNDMRELENQNAKMRKELERAVALLPNDVKHTIDLISILPEKGSNNRNTLSEDNADQEVHPRQKQGALPKIDLEAQEEIPNKRHSRIDVINEDVISQKISMLNAKLEEANKSIATEREEKASLHRGIEKLRNKIIQFKDRCDELQDSRAEALKELVEIKSRFQGELNAAQADLFDEANNREGMDQRLSELRAELEKLQAENAAEWGKRERLETEKISLERENKQLRSDLRELQERADCRRPRPTSSCDVDSKQLQLELLERNKELVDLKHSHAKLKKILAEKTTDLSHAMRRSEQYEAEVRRIRARVEELKKELALAQDELDGANNATRKLQRINEDLNEQIESSRAQLEHYRNSISENRAPDVVAEIIDDKTLDDIEDEKIDA